MTRNQSNALKEKAFLEMQRFNFKGRVTWVGREDGFTGEHSEERTGVHGQRRQDMGVIGRGICMCSRWEGVGKYRKKQMGSQRAENQQWPSLVTSRPL